MYAQLFFISRCNSRISWQKYYISRRKTAIKNYRGALAIEDIAEPRVRGIFKTPLFKIPPKRRSRKCRRARVKLVSPDFVLFPTDVKRWRREKSRGREDEVTRPPTLNANERIQKREIIPCFIWIRQNGRERAHAHTYVVRVVRGTWLAKLTKGL